MALTVTLSGDWMKSSGNERAVNGTITFDSSYAAGGESLTAANIGLGKIENIQFNQGQTGYVFKYDYSAAKVLAYQQTDPANAGGANIPLVEVGDTTNLSAVVLKFRATGY